ncbi:hypothetical protein AAG906_028091 [Vitis piasezkii]
MGKYMKKAKITGDVTVMEVSSSLGVRTRAKTLALQRLQKTTHQEGPKPDTSYLELRSRRLEKPPLLSEPNKKQNPNPKASSRVELGSVNSNSVGSVPPGEKINAVETEDVGVEASYGENVLEFEGRDRSTRESTPCSLIRDPDTIATPGSTTRPTSSSVTTRRVRSNVLGDIPTAAELEEFFTHAEEHAQKEFMDKYNFDIVNDTPLLDALNGFK